MGLILCHFLILQIKEDDGVWHHKASKSGRNTYLFIKTTMRTHRELWSSKPGSLESGTGSCREPRERWSPGPRPRFPPVDLQESREALQLGKKKVPVAVKWVLSKERRESAKTSCDKSVNTQNVPYFSAAHARMTVTSGMEGN